MYQGHEESSSGNNNGNEQDPPTYMTVGKRVFIQLPTSTVLTGVTRLATSKDKKNSKS